MGFVKVWRNTILALHVIGISINNCRVEGKVVSSSFGEFNEKPEQSETDKKFFEQTYEYYRESLEKLFKPRIVDLDTYDFSYDETQLYPLDLDIQSYQDADNKVDHESMSPAMHFNSLCPDIPFNFPEKYGSDLCHAKICLDDQDCLEFGDKKDLTPNDSLYVCCFNGCVPTCLRGSDPPKAFDWIEETDEKFKEYDNKEPKKLKSLQFLEENSSEDTIVLPGGCVVTPKQLEELQLFRKYDHVETCTCKDGEVVCQVNSRHSDLS